MGGSSSEKGYVPPLYIPLRQSDRDEDDSEQEKEEEEQVASSNSNTKTNGAVVVQTHQETTKSGALSPPESQWTSGICACCDDMPSCCIGLLCPCFLFGKNAEFLGSGTLAGSCMTHCILWGIVNAFCCCITDGTLLCFPGGFVACYACGYRRALRFKYNLPEAPCGDLTTHLFCHVCAICQEYREIRDRSDSNANANDNNIKFPQVTPPSLQTMPVPIPIPPTKHQL